MKKIVYPDWVEKYRKKGRTVRKVRNGYGLYECTSVYVKGQKYPKSVQNYLGMITEKDGFIPKKSKAESPVFLEYGLSFFIMKNFKRDLIRSSYDKNMDIIILGIILYMFGACSASLIHSSYISKGRESSLCNIYDKGTGKSRIKSVRNKIEKRMKEEIPDDDDRNTLRGLLLLSTIEKKSPPEGWIPPSAAVEIAQRYGVSL